MTLPIYAEAATRLLRQESMRREEPVISDREDDTILRMQNAMRKNRTRARLVRGGGIGMAIAAGISSIFVAKAMSSHHEVAVAPAPPSEWTVSGRVDGATGKKDGALTVGEKVTAVGDSSFAFPSGTEVTIHDHTETILLEKGKANIFSLERGALEAKVAKLGKDERFVVRTKDAEFEVRGTRFEVSTLSGSACSSATRLRVTEGVVAARHAGHEVLVHAGEVWPSACWGDIDDGIDPTSLESVGTDPAITEVKRDPTVARPRHAGSIATKATSTLSEENDLFADAIAAKRAGNSALAVRSLNQLLTRYPASPLRESAEVERLRILAAVNHKQASTAARKYLARFPKGAGREEAESILRGRP